MTDDDLREAYAFPAQRPWVRANMVSTLDGAIRGPNGQARSITTPADQRVFSIARLAADVILVGAGTIRAEDYQPSKRTVAIVSARLNLPMSLRLFAERTAAHPRSIVFTTDEAAAHSSADLREVADVVGCGHGTVDLHQAVDELVARGLSRILCEGGPSLLSDMTAAGLVDELLLTVSPLLLGATEGEHIIEVDGGFDPPRGATAEHVLEEDGTVFIRALVR